MVFIERPGGPTTKRVNSACRVNYFLGTRVFELRNREFPLAFQELIVELAVQIDRIYCCVAGIIESLRSAKSVTIYSFEVTIIIKEDSILSQKNHIFPRKQYNSPRFICLCLFKWMNTQYRSKI